MPSNSPDKKYSLGELPDISHWLSRIQFKDPQNHEYLACMLATIADEHISRGEELRRKICLNDLGMIDAQLVQLNLL